MPPKVRLLAALALAPLVASAVAAMLLGAIATCPRYGCDSYILMYAGLAGTAYGALIGIPTAFLVGLPAHHILSLTGRTHVALYVVAGGAIGLPASIIGSAILIRGSLNMSGEGWGFLCAIGASVGAMSALIFWLIRRPDRDAANPDTRAP